MIWRYRRSRRIAHHSYRKHSTRGIVMSASPVLWDLDERGVATVTLNRPEVNNAYDAGLINGVLAAMDELGKQPQLRVVVLKGNGKHFQAGADLKWIDGVRPGNWPWRWCCSGLTSAWFRGTR
jgi:1,4-dihydroxy-2-naphthoyl-CoA synthase